MAYFAYKGRHAGGRLVQDVRERADSAAVATELFGSGITPVEVDPTRAQREPSKYVLGSLKHGRVHYHDRRLSIRQMHTLLKAGVPINRALGGLQESASN